MSDQVVGVAVLWRNQKEPLTGRLYIRCRYAGGDFFDDDIPVMERAQHRSDDDYWSFKVVGDSLQVHPSVRTQRPPEPEWHNQYQWGVRFVDYDPSYGTPYAQLREVNAPEIRPGGRD